MLYPIGSRATNPLIPVITYESKFTLAHWSEATRFTKRLVNVSTSLVRRTSTSHSALPTHAALWFNSWLCVCFYTVKRAECRIVHIKIICSHVRWSLSSVDGCTPSAAYHVLCIVWHSKLDPPVHIHTDTLPTRGRGGVCTMHMSRALY